MKKNLASLEKKYLGESGGTFFELIVERQLIGEMQQVMELFNEMGNSDKERFLLLLTEKDDYTLNYGYEIRRECFVNIVNNLFKTR